MESMGVFGLMGFVMAILALERVKRLERTLRENNIRSGAVGDLGIRLKDRVGETVTITLYGSEGSTTTVCRVVDADEEWARVVRNEGKKSQRELLIRLSDVKQIKG